MWARSHTSGLMISVCWASTSASDRGSTSASVRSRPSARASVRGWGAILFRGYTSGLAALLRRCAARLAPHADHLADRRGTPGDARVERPDGELEAAGLELLELGHERMEAPALLVHEHDVAGRDALRRRPPRGRLALFGLEVDEGALVHVRDARQR